MEPMSAGRSLGLRIRDLHPAFKIQAHSTGGYTNTSHSQKKVGICIFKDVSHLLSPNYPAGLRRPWICVQVEASITRFPFFAATLPISSLSDSFDGVWDPEAASLLVWRWELGIARFD